MASAAQEKNVSLQKCLCKISILIEKLNEHMINKFNNSSFTIKSIKNMNVLFLHENAEDKSQFNVAPYGASGYFGPILFRLC